MKNTEPPDNQIVDYLTGQGTEAERAAFASRIAADPHLRRQVEEARHALDAFHHLRRADLRNRLRALDRQPRSHIRRMDRHHIYLVISAVLMALLLVRLLAC